jgi:cell wall assembly regulator SMI1
MDKHPIFDSDEDDCHSHPSDAVKRTYTHEGWIFFAGVGGNQLAIDFSPDKSGVVGQVINFGRDASHLYQIAKDFTGFLEFTLDMYKNKKAHHLFCDYDPPPPGCTLKEVLAKKYGVPPYGV